jgi:hypothetical protein
VASGIYNFFASARFLDFLEYPNILPRADNKHFVLFSLKTAVLERIHKWGSKRLSENWLIFVEL